MDYKLYTLVDITHTGQHRNEQGKEQLRWKEQNFQTVLQTIGIRANITFKSKPEMLEVGGKTIGFNTAEVIRVWRFDFSTERENLFENEGDPIGYLKDDFELVPYITGLDELLEQNYAVFTTRGTSPNIIFYEKE
jgi:hypothetical protein